ncbi:MAG: zf-HC2 domain-containing protein [Deltaproteobacteria bacterium]|nr:zf-HC2 domain-containing protein [Deltaproteobacteria bacterium]
MSAGDPEAIPSCQRVVECLPAWFEGALPSGEEGPMERHLVLCPPCGHLARTYRRVGDVARAAMEVRLPPAAAERLGRLLRARFAARPS